MFPERSPLRAGAPDVIVFSTVVYPLERSASHFTYIHIDGLFLRHLSDLMRQNGDRSLEVKGAGEL